QGIAKIFAGEDIAVGQKTFDDRVNLRGPEAPMLAILNERNRGSIETMTGDLEATLKEGTLEIRELYLVTEARELESMLESMVDLSERLASGCRDNPKSLAENAARDSQAPVRLRNLEALVKHYPTSKI